VPSPSAARRFNYKVLQNLHFSGGPAISLASRQFTAHLGAVYFLPGRAITLTVAETYGWWLIQVQLRVAAGHGYLGNNFSRGKEKTVYVRCLNYYGRALPTYVYVLVAGMTEAAKFTAIGRAR